MLNWTHETHFCAWMNYFSFSTSWPFVKFQFCFIVWTDILLFLQFAVKLAHRLSTINCNEFHRMQFSQDCDDWLHCECFLCSLDMQANIAWPLSPPHHHHLLPLPNGLILTIWLTGYCRTPHPQLRWSDTRPTSASWSAPSWRRGTARGVQPSGRRGCPRLPCAHPDLMRHQW